MTPSQWRFFAATVFLFAGGLTLYLTGGRQEDWVSLLTVALSFLAVTLALYFEGREDPDAVLLWAGGVLLGLASVLGVFYLSAFRPPSWLVPVTGLAALLGSFALAWTWSRQRAPADPDFPDVLAAVEPRGPIRETNRVQFAAFVRRGGGTEPHWIDLTLQNCCSAPRNVGFRFLGPWARKLKVPVPAGFVLGPAEVRKLSLPVVTREKEGSSSGSRSWGRAAGGCGSAGPGARRSARRRRPAPSAFISTRSLRRSGTPPSRSHNPRSSGIPGRELCRPETRPVGRNARRPARVDRTETTTLRAPRAVQPRGGALA